MILDPYFRAMREVFVGYGLTECRTVKLQADPLMHDEPRHFAGTRDDGRVMLVSPEMAELPEPTVSAIFAHEFGHATDFLYPGEFVLGVDRVAVRRDRESFSDSSWHRWLKDWEARDDDVIEFVADAIGEMVTGKRIGYPGPCKIQTFGRGMARPRGLR
jgi:hypothetical protein